jgi:hypothetical protein
MSETWLQEWPAGYQLAACEQCDWIFLVPVEQLSPRCPHCGQDGFTMLDPTDGQPIYTQPPELVAPFTISQDKREQSLSAFTRRGWFAPEDLTVERLNGRLCPIYLPMWLVDADVTAVWQAEMGFDYQVVSHRERYQNGRWQSEEVRETRVRWEPRLGQLQRHYANSRAPALEEQPQLTSALGAYRLSDAQAYTPAQLDSAFVRLPNRPPNDAWPEAETTIKKKAVADCQKAAQANHLRDFRWTAEFHNQHWTQLLYPVYATYYGDDEGRTHPILINGQTGQLSGTFRASTQRAWQWSKWIGLGTAVLLVLTLLLLLLANFLEPDGILPIASIALLLTIMTGLAALIPPILAWSTNRSK